MSDETITLRLEGERISADDLYKKIGDFLEMLRDVDQSITEELDTTRRARLSVKWVVESIRSDSPVTMTLRPEPLRKDSSPSAGEQIIRAVTTGLEMIGSTVPMERLPAHFSFPILDSVRKLTRHGIGGVTGITVVTPERTVKLSSVADDNLRRFLFPVYTNYGSVEGVLQMVAVDGGGLRFSVRDRLSGRSIRCTVPRERQRDVLDVFDHRVSVAGRVRVNERGDVLSIVMESITAVPTDEQLPDIKDVAGKFDLAGDNSISAHVAWLRDAS